MYFVYILQCADKSLYTGSTNDIKHRLKQHNGLISGGAKYTKVRRPVKIVRRESWPNLSKARTREAEIKRLSRTEKLMLIKNKE